MVFQTITSWISRTARIIWETLVISWLAVYYISAAALETVTPGFLRARKNLSGQIALVTGGGGGVGKELALRLARAKAVVVLWDKDERSLETIRDDLKEQGYNIHTYVVDVSDRKCVHKNAELVKEEVGAVDILINNAGIVYGKPLLDLPDEIIEKTYQVNILAHYWTTKSFLGDMITRGSGHIVTVASVAGLMGTYLCTDYSATKFAAVGFHESLFTELRTHKHNGIHTTLVCPYYIDTGMFAGVKPRLLNMLKPGVVASRIVRAIKTNEVLVVMPAMVRYLLPLKSMLPAELCWAIMYRVLRGPQAMKTFKGSHQVAAA